MAGDVLRELEARMERSVEAFRRELAGYRAGRASPALLERVMVDYYQTPTPVNQLATVSAPEPRLLVVQPWDRALLPTIEKAIQKSDLGITPTSDGTVIRLAVPPLTEERRRELVKTVHKKAEEARVELRGERRGAVERIKAMARQGEMTEDASRRTQEEVQKLTDRFIAHVDRLVHDKEQEIMSG